MVCAFFGHRDTPISIYPRLVRTIEYLIQDRKIHTFIVGNQGSFDAMVIKALSEAKQRYKDLCCKVILAYMPTDPILTEYDGLVETCLPEGVELAPRRFVIPWVNKWIVRQSDIVVCYITHSWGGASTFVEIARRQKKEIINIA